MEFKILIKKLNNSLTSSEEKVFDIWYKESSKHKEFFKTFQENFYKEDTQVDVEKGWLKLNESIHKKPKKVSFWKYASVAAVFIGILTSTYFFKTSRNKTPIIVNNNIKIDANKTTLTLGDGSNIALGKGKKYTSKGVKSNGEELIYDAKNDSKSEITYNYLTIPRGNDFFVQLSDGTKVFLNSDSQLKYPVTFNKGETRNVELLYGEAYFEVSPSSKHNGDSFRVLTKNQEVNVLGTHFNIKAYNEDLLISTTLLEGKVSVNKGLNTVLLKPNQQSRISTKTKIIEVLEVDISHEVAWIKGIFSFNQEPLDEIMKVLSRRYNVEVSFESEKAKKYQFTVILKRETTITEILKFFKSTSNGDLKYTIKDKKIVIK
ncbi:FecR family protein [Polaribacter sp.]|jgi:transmembrane sensor|uniref:FecR family protein n=1 Tax=Polaribacter sp. TaxID=1920175 RepID=UPI003EEF3D9D